MKYIKIYDYLIRTIGYSNIEFFNFCANIKFTHFFKNDVHSFELLIYLRKIEIEDICDFLRKFEILLKNNF